MRSQPPPIINFTFLPWFRLQQYNCGPIILLGYQEGSVTTLMPRLLGLLLRIHAGCLV